MLAQQLLQLGEGHPSPLADPQMCRTLAGVVPQLYSALGGLEGGDAEVARLLLQGGACVWVGDGFVAAARVAFQVGGLEEAVGEIALELGGLTVVQRGTVLLYLLIWQNVTPKLLPVTTGRWSHWPTEESSVEQC